MDCFNHFCPYRQNITSDYNHCDYWTCQNRCEEPVIYITSNYTLTADEIARMTNDPNYDIGTGYQE